MADRTLTIPLDPPVAHAGGELKEIKLREPTGKEMEDAARKLDAGASDAAFSDFVTKLVSAVSGVAEEALNKLPGAVMDSAAEFALGFNRRVEEFDQAEIVLPETVADAGVSYSSLKLHEPTWGSRRQAETALNGGRTPANQRRYQMILVAQSSDVPFAVVQKLPVSVLNQAEAYLRRFFPSGPPTGTS